MVWPRRVAAHCGVCTVAMPTAEPPARPRAVSGVVAKWRPWASDRVPKQGGTVYTSKAISEQRVVKIANAVLSKTSKSACLVDAPGGELMALEIVDKGELLSTTFAVLLVVADASGNVTYRAVRDQ